MTQQTALPDVNDGSRDSQFDTGAVAESVFASPRLRLDRLSTVRAGTLVIELAAQSKPVLRHPGELLIPSWSPRGAGLEVVVLTTEPVLLRVSVDRVLTMDGEMLALVELDLSVRLLADHVLDLIADRGPDFAAGLRLEVQRTAESGVRAAAGMNRAQDLRRHSLAPVLDERWLPSTLVDGAVALESLSLREVRWSATSEPEVSPDDDTTRIDRLPDETAPTLRLGQLGREDRHRAVRSAEEALAQVYLPAVISVGVCWIFWVAYWLPELQTLPGARFLLEQLSPLASKELTSGGHALVTGQGGHSGATPAILLAASLMLAPLARSRYWVARLALWPVTYVAAVAAAVAVLGVLLRGRLAADLLGVALLVAWVSAAVVTTWRSLWVDIDTLPRRPSDVAWLLGLFALVSPAPIAVGRAVFAPELRLAALGVVDNDPALRWAALLTPATAWIYLSGLLLGVLAWAGYLLWPPRAKPGRLPLTALLAALVGLLMVGPQAHQAAARQAEVMRTQSPPELSFSCGVWTQPQPDQPVLTLVISGLGCTRVTTFSGYRQTTRRESGIALSPVRAETFAGDRIRGRLVSARYGSVVVLAATDRLDRRPTAVIGVRLADGMEHWRFPCTVVDGRPRGAAKLRFAGATDGDHAVAGRQTRRGERPAVVLDCGRGPERIDPRTGRRV